jgi:regulator of replication initiation timing
MIVYIIIYNTVRVIRSNAKEQVEEHQQLALEDEKLYSNLIHN